MICAHRVHYQRGELFVTQITFVNPSNFLCLIFKRPVFILIVFNPLGWSDGVGLRCVPTLLGANFIGLVCLLQNKKKQKKIIVF